MAPMARIRAVPTAVRSAAARGETLLHPSISAIQTRRNATSAAIQEPRVEYPGSVPPVPVPQRKSALEQRIEAVKKAKPFSDFLTDTFNRQHDYLRISITERCNLRCLYCMPEEGIPLSPAAHMLTTPEIFYLSSLFVSQGVTKIRLTGGEPTVRRDIVPMMQQIGSLRPKGLRELALTTNGISLHRKLDAMVEAGLTGVNMSLDTLDPFQFQIMTRRNGFEAVMRSINRILEMNKLGAGIKLKVNCVVMRGLNEREIIPFVEMGREKDIEVRFIEYMPFGGNKWSQGKMISFQEMLDIITAKYPDLRRLPGHKNDTSKTFEVPGFVGKVGFITSMTNDFCGTCNRLRITSDGNLKVCLHGNAEVSLRDVLRQGNDGQPIDQEAFERIKQLEMDRHEGRLSDETILGWGQREHELLNVIGTAVKRKAEKHADMGDLENMTNRPMILIGEAKSEYANAFPHTIDNRMIGSARIQSSLWINSQRQPSLMFSSPLGGLSQKRWMSIRPVRARSARKSPDPIAVLSKPPNSNISDPYLNNDVKPEDRPLLLAVVNRGPRRSPLPPQYEAIRQKYELTHAMYDKYWRLTARALLLGPKSPKDSKTVHIQAQKYLQLARERLFGKTIAHRGAGHVGLMLEAHEGIEAAQPKSSDVKNTEDDTIKRTESRIQALQQDVRYLLERARRTNEKIKNAAVERITEQPTHKRKDTTRAQWRENRKIAARIAEQHGRQNSIYLQRQRQLDLLSKQLLICEKELNHLREAGGLYDRLERVHAVEGKANTIKWRYELLKEQKESSMEIDEILDTAVAKDLTLTRMAMKDGGNGTTNVFHSSDVAASTSAKVTSTLQAPFLDEVTHFPTPSSSSASHRQSQHNRLSDSLHFRLPSSGKFVIDSDLIIAFDVPTKTLQEQVKQMQSRLKASYPRIDDMPFDIWTSTNRTTLKTWIKILVMRWVTRFDNDNNNAQGERMQVANDRIKKVLDQMVRDHDLSNEAADRMAQRWAEIFKRRHEGSSNTAETSNTTKTSNTAKTLNTAETSNTAGIVEEVSEWDGHSFLRDEVAESQERSVKNETAYVPASNKPRTEHTTKRLYSTSSRPRLDPALSPALPNTTPTSPPTPSSKPQLPHLTSTGAAHMVSVSAKAHTTRTAIAVGTVSFTNPTPLSLIQSNALQKGDVLSVSRIAGIMAAKKCPDIIPLCHPITLTHVAVQLRTFPPCTAKTTTPWPGSAQRPNDSACGGGVHIEARVECTGQTGVEMEALTGVMGAALSVVDMCKAVDRFQRIGDVRVVVKEGGKSGGWREEGWRSVWD